jgi:hypothetical protein
MGGQVFNKRNAFIGWLVLTFGKPVAKRKARQAVSGKRAGVVGATLAGVGAGVGALMFWRKRRGGTETQGS